MNPETLNKIIRFCEESVHYKRVKAFMRGAGQAIPDAPSVPDQATRELRATLLLEEVFETIENGLGVTVYDRNANPLHADFLDCIVDAPYNAAELLDGCCDVHVIVTGTLIAAGLKDARPQRLVDQNNLAKLGPGHRIRDDGKLIKPADHRPPDLNGEIRRQIAERQP